jgi:hypothetical protein
MSCCNAVAENGAFGPMLVCKLLIGRHQGKLCINNKIQEGCLIPFILDEANLSEEMDT